MAEPPRQDPDIASRVLSGIYELACSSGRGEPMPRAVSPLRGSDASLGMRESMR